MIPINRVMLMGGVTRDLDMRYTSQGTAWGNSSLAIRRFSKGPDRDEPEHQTDYIEIKFWGPVTEQAERLFRKGRSVYVEGHLKVDHWDDKQTGEKRHKLVVVADAVGELE